MKYRINNFVKYNGLEIQLTSEYFDNNLLDKIEPISLTEYWLLKFRFRYKENFVKEDINIYKDINQEFHYVQKVNGSIDFIKNLQYVHEFQNLYFELKGKELRVNPDDSSVRN